METFFFWAFHENFFFTDFLNLWQIFKRRLKIFFITDFLKLWRIFENLMKIFFFHRFSEALANLEEAMKILEKFKLDEVQNENLVLPGTEKPMMESSTEGMFAECLKLMNLCRLPPAFDFFCIGKNCTENFYESSGIFAQDPDYKGHVKIRCTDACVAHLHLECWTSLRISKFSGMSEKVFECF